MRWSESQNSSFVALYCRNKVGKHGIYLYSYTFTLAFWSHFYQHQSSTHTLWCACVKSTGMSRSLSENCTFLMLCRSYLSFGTRSFRSIGRAMWSESKSGCMYRYKIVVNMYKVCVLLQLTVWIDFSPEVDVRDWIKWCWPTGCHRSRFCHGICP